jgi:hypothetical protein
MTIHTGAAKRPLSSVVTLGKPPLPPRQPGSTLLPRKTAQVKSTSATTTAAATKTPTSTAKSTTHDAKITEQMVARAKLYHMDPKTFVQKRQTYMEWFKKTQFYLDFDHTVSAAERNDYITCIRKLGGVRPCVEFLML